MTKPTKQIKNTMDFNMSVPSSSPSLENVKTMLWVNAGVTIFAMLGIGLVMTYFF